MVNDYAQFLASKAVCAPQRGLTDIPPLASYLFPFQRRCVEFGLRVGSYGLFLDTGLGKTACELEWCLHAAAASNGHALILTPLAVARQIEREAARWGYEQVRVIRDQSEARPGTNICNYDRLDKLDPDAFGAVALDESSILKQFTGATSRALINAFAGHRWKMAATATPAPNDHMELGQHAEFLSVMPSNEMLMRWFITDQTEMGRYRLKGHARLAFWDWMTSWCRMAGHPRDLGDDVDGFDLPALNVHRIELRDDLSVRLPGELFAGLAVSATSMHQVKRQTADARAAEAARLLAAEPTEAWVVWCDTDYEADAILRAIPETGDVREVRGSQTIDEKETALADFAEGRARVIVTKPSVAGHGLNWQHVARMIFVGRTFSYESWYQAVRRSWRFGQSRPVEVYLIVAAGEDAIGRVIIRKERDHDLTKREMRDAMHRAIGESAGQRVSYEAARAAEIPGWIASDDRPTVRCLASAESRQSAVYHGDCVDVLRQWPADSLGFAVYSPPFSGLYIYNDSVADMGNSASDDEFFEHYGYFAKELYRTMMPGRCVAVHCKDLVFYRTQRGTAGLRDFPGMLIRAHEQAGFNFHSRITIWRCPVREMTKTKAQGLLYKQLRADSSFCRQGLAEYLVVFRKWSASDLDIPSPVTHTRTEFPLDQWQEWASPVWTDTRETDVLNTQAAREPNDEKHICPMPMDLITRAIVLWSNPGDVVLSPFAGIGSEGVCALRAGRRFVGIELKESYFRQAVKYVHAEDSQCGLALGDAGDYTVESQAESATRAPGLFPAGEPARIAVDGLPSDGA
jgi:DNA modification methylase